MYSCFEFPGKMMLLSCSIGFPITQTNAYSLFVHFFRFPSILFFFSQKLLFLSISFVKSSDIHKSKNEYFWHPAFLLLRDEKEKQITDRLPDSKPLFFSLFYINVLFICFFNFSFSYFLFLLFEHENSSMLGSSLILFSLSRCLCEKAFVNETEL